MIYAQLLQEEKIRVTSSMEPEICKKMLKELSEKLRAKFPDPVCGYTMVRVPCLDDAFSECFELEQSPVEGQSLQPKDKKRRKRKGEKKIVKPKDVGHFLAQKCAFRAVHPRAKCCKKCDTSGKKGMLSCCKCLFEYIGVNMTHIYAENLQNVPKMCFWQKLQESMG